MNAFIPVWIIGGPFVGLLILAFSFRGPSAMEGSGPRLPPRRSNLSLDQVDGLLEPMHPEAPRRHV
jgi:hypothetical protein